MKTTIKTLIFSALLLTTMQTVCAQTRRPVDSQHPMWLVHVDVWNKADPQKIIDLIPAEVKPYVVLNLSLSCQYDKDKNVYKMPQNAVKTYKSWGTVCQANGMWFTCQPASGGHTHIMDDDLETFEYFYKTFPNFLGWNYAEQFWGFDEAGDRSSSSQGSRIALFANLVPMAHKYGGFLTVSFCGNIWSHALNPVGMMKRNSNLYNACKKYPDAILWLYKYTTSSCFYNNESVTFSPFVSGLAKSYGVRYDNCGWKGAIDAISSGKKYPESAGIATVLEQTCVNGGAVWDGPELIWNEDFRNLNNSTVDGYTRRNWGTFAGFDNIWMDMWKKIIDGSLYIPTREEVVDRIKIMVINDVSSGNDEQKYAAWGDLYDNVYKQRDPMNRGNGQWMDNYCYFKSTGRYATIPVTIGTNDALSKKIPLLINKSSYGSRWSTQQKKVADFERLYPEISKGDLFVSRFKNQLLAYTPYSYFNTKRTATADIPLLYNTCESMTLKFGMLCSGMVQEYSDHINFYLNNYRTDSTAVVLDEIVIKGATSRPTFKATKRVNANVSATNTYDEATGTYTLSVKHMGPVDVVINCSGKATDRKTDVVSSTPLTLDPPRLPAEYHGPITIEAEDMDYKNVRSCVTDPYSQYPNVRGHAGNGFQDMGTNTAGSLRHNLKLKKAGEYNIYVRYMSTQKAAVLSSTVNGVKKSYRFEKTANNEWKRAYVTANLKAGVNSFTITNSGGVSMYIDNITYQPTDVPLEKFAITIRPTENGTVEAPDSAADGETVTLKAVPAEGYKLAGWTVSHGNITVDGNNTFTMPEDNVTLTPVFADVSSIYNLDFTSVLNGEMPPGWQATQEDNQVHSYPSTYSSGARTFIGFTGYQGKALYWRENNAEYGRQNGYLLTLEPGWYKLTFAMAAWKAKPQFTAQILSTSNAVIAQSSAYYALPNANGNTSATVTTTKKYDLEFKITKKANYIIRFLSKDVVDGYDEFLLLMCKVLPIEDPSGIEQITTDTFSTAPAAIYDLNGRRIDNLQKGINIVRGQDGKTRKVLVK